MTIKIYLSAAALTILAAASACSSLATKADNPPPRAETTAGVVGENPPGATNASTPAAASQLTAQTVAGSYKYKTGGGRGRKGYLGSLEIEAKENGKIGVRLEVTHVYEANGAETFKETTAAGEAALENGAASVEMTEAGGDEPCRVTISFTLGEATVRSDAGCRFNAPLDGVYQKEKTRRRDKAKSEEYVAHVEYSRLREYVDDIDNHKPGEEFVIEAVPTIRGIERADENGDPAFKGLYWLSPDGEKSVATSLFAPSAMVSRLRSYLDSDFDHLRIESVLMEVAGAGEVYRTSYAVRIEAVDAAGKVLWAVTGAKPKRPRIEY